MKAAAWILFVAGLGAAAFFLLRPIICELEPADRGLARNEVVGLCNALRFFHKEYGTYPAGTAREIVGQLTSNNIRRIAFLEVSRSGINSVGEFCDPWNTPYHIAISLTNASVRSAGPDKRFDTKDDIAAGEAGH